MLVLRMGLSHIVDIELRGQSLTLAALSFYRLLGRQVVTGPLGRPRLNLAG